MTDILVAGSSFIAPSVSEGIEDIPMASSSSVIPIINEGTSDIPVASSSSVPTLHQDFNYADDSVPDDDATYHQIGDLRIPESIFGEGGDAVFAVSRSFTQFS
jgi:hypothetical protein